MHNNYPNYAQYYDGYYQAYPDDSGAYSGEYQYSENQYGYQAYGTEPPPPQSTLGRYFEFSNHDYVKGFVVGAVAALILANPGVQKILVRGAVKTWSTFQGGVEEMKEQFQDVRAEMSQKE